ncbi:hypothetical protein AOLI_G00165370 [Acnodon oligacanthus]
MEKRGAILGLKRTSVSDAPPQAKRASSRRLLTACPVPWLWPLDANTADRVNKQPLTHPNESHSADGSRATAQSSLTFSHKTLNKLLIACTVDELGSAAHTDTQRKNPLSGSAGGRDNTAATWLETSQHGRRVVEN